MKGAVRGTRRQQHAGIDVQAMYPAGAPPKADQWTYDTFLEAAKEDHSRAADDVEEVHRGGDSERAGYASGEQQRGRDVASYIYQDENGAPYLCVTRTSAKQFPQTRWQDGRWVWGKPAGPKIPYRLPELVAAAPTTQYSSVRARRTPTASLRSGSTQPQTRRAPVSGPRSLTSGSQESRQSTS